jgi:hypothetical protein
MIAKISIFAFILALPAHSAEPLRVKPSSECIASPCVSSFNIPFDAIGDLDTRLGTWGTAAAVVTPIQFSNVPAGLSVHVLRAYGDFIAWAHGKVARGTNAGVLWALSSTAVTTSKDVEWAAEGCFLYLQGSVNAANLRAPFDQDLSAGGWLSSDNVMLSKEAVWLNDTGLSVHAEATVVIVYEFAIHSREVKG